MTPLDALQNFLTFGVIPSSSLSRFHSGSHLTDHTRPETELQRSTSIETSDKRPWFRGLESPGSEELCPIQQDFVDPACRLEVKLNLSTINEAPVGDDEDPSPRLKNIQVEKIRWASDRGIVRPNFDAKREDGNKTPNCDSKRDTPMLATQANGPNMNTVKFEESGFSFGNQQKKLILSNNCGKSALAGCTKTNQGPSVTSQQLPGSKFKEGIPVRRSPSKD